MSQLPTATRFPVIEYSDASGAVKEIYDDILKYHSFVPNWYKTQGTNPQILAGNWGKIKSTLFTGVVPLVLKQMVLWSISKSRKCHYCETIHFLEAKSLQGEISSDPTFDLTNDLDNPLIPQTFRAAVTILTEVATNPLQTKTEHYDALRDEGFNDQEIRELFAQVGLAILMNTYADISGVMVDEEALSSN